MCDKVIASRIGGTFLTHGVFCVEWDVKR